MSEYEALFGVVPDSGGKSTSSLLSKWTKKIRKFVGSEKVFKDMWKTLRGAIDTASAMAGVPVSEFRRQLDNRGVDSDVFSDVANAALEAFTDTDGNLNATSDQINDVYKASEVAAKNNQAINPDMKMLILGGLAFFLLPGLFRQGRGRRRRGRRRGRRY